MRAIGIMSAYVGAVPLILVAAVVAIAVNRGMRG